MADLDRAVLAPRRPWRRPALVIGGTLAAVSANVVAVAWLLHPLVPGHDVVLVQPLLAEAHDADVCAAPAAERATATAPAPVTIVAPAPPPAASAPSVPAPLAIDAARACPPPRTDAPRITPELLDERVDHVTVAPSNVGWVAAWNDDHVFVSTDAGAHFARVLDGPGAVSDVGFDCFGTVVVLRERRLGLRVGGDERWSTVDGVELMSWPGPDVEQRGHAAIVSGGPEIVIVGRTGGESWDARIARSRDLGAHWRYHDVEGDWETPSVLGRQREDGTIAITIPAMDCEAEGSTVVTIRRGALTTDLGGLWPGPGQRFEADEWPAGLPPGATYAGDELVRAGDALYRVRGARAVRLPVVAEDDAYTRDAAGRLWTVHCGMPIIAGKRPSAITCEPEQGED